MVSARSSTGGRHYWRKRACRAGIVSDALEPVCRTRMLGEISPRSARGALSLEGAPESGRREGDDVGRRGVISSPPLPRPCSLPIKDPPRHLPPPRANQRSCESNAGNAALLATMPPPGAIEIPPVQSAVRQDDALLLPLHVDPERRSCMRAVSPCIR